MNGNDGIRAVFPGDRRRFWATSALLALGGWLVVSPLLLSTTRVTASVVSAVGSGLALVVLAGWARAARCTWVGRRSAAARMRRRPSG